MSKGSAILTYSTPAEAQQAISQLNRSTIPGPSSVFFQQDGGMLRWSISFGATKELCFGSAWYSIIRINICIREPYSIRVDEKKVVHSYLSPRISSWQAPIPALTRQLMTTPILKFYFTYTKGCLGSCHYTSFFGGSGLLLHSGMNLNSHRQIVRWLVQFVWLFHRSKSRQ